jgi:hypothetical protein
MPVIAYSLISCIPQLMLPTLFLASQIANRCFISLVESVTLSVTLRELRGWQGHLA